MTADDYRTCLKALGLTVNEAGRFLAVNERTARRVADGDLPIPFAVEALLSVMIRYDITIEMVNTATNRSKPASAIQG
jgi:hypothetical protein